MSQFKTLGQLIGTGLSEGLDPGPITSDGFGPVPIAPKSKDASEAKTVAPARGQGLTVRNDDFGPVSVTDPQRERLSASRASGGGSLEQPTPRYSLMNDMLGLINQAGGFARQNRYQVLIPVGDLTRRSNNIFNLNNAVLEFSDLEAWDWVKDYYQLDTEAEAVRLTAFCDKAEIPGYQFQMETNRHYGPSFKIPHTPEYQDITLTFMCGSDMLERYIIDTWMYLVMDPETNNFNYIDEYALDIEIYQIQEADNDPNRTENGRPREQQGFVSEDGLVYNYYTKLIEAYPIAINAQELAYDANNTIQKLQVTFTYKFAIPFAGKGATSTGRRLRGAKQNFGDTVQLTPLT